MATPVSIPGYQIYRDNSTIGAVVNLAGYGKSGRGSTGTTISFGTLRQGENRYDTYWDMPGSPYAYDFDDGSPDRDAIGALAGIYNTGTGTQEVMIAPGDSGGPSFYDGKIIGVHSFGSTFGTPLDIDNVLNASFGEMGGDTRVAAYADWIDQTVPLPGTLLLLGPVLAGLILWRGFRRPTES